MLPRRTSVISGDQECPFSQISYECPYLMIISSLNVRGTSKIGFRLQGCSSKAWMLPYTKKKKAGWNMPSSS